MWCKKCVCHTYVRVLRENHNSPNYTNKCISVDEDASGFIPLQSSRTTMLLENSSNTRVTEYGSSPVHPSVAPPHLQDNTQTPQHRRARPAQGPISPAPPAIRQLRLTCCHRGRRSHFPFLKFETFHVTFPFVWNVLFVSSNSPLFLHSSTAVPALPQGHP